MSAISPAPDSVSARVAQARKLAGLTQERLAGQAAISVSLLRKVERGAVPASPAFLGAVAKALGATVSDLTGQPFPPLETQDGEFGKAIAIIRSELAAYDLDNLDVRTIRPLPEISREIQDVCQYRRGALFHKLADTVPPLLAEVRAAVHRSSGHTRERAFTLLCELYYSSHSLAHKLGYTDLAARAIDRLAWAATESGNPTWIAASDFHRAAIMTSGGDWQDALQFLDRCRSGIESRLSIGNRQDLIAWGGLHLQSGLAAARAGNRSLADDHLGEARSTASRLGDDRDQILSFGPTNVGIWGVALAVEALDGAEALNRSRNLIIPAGTPKERAGHHYIDLARAYLLHGDRSQAMNALEMAKTIAPSQTRYNAMVHETIRALARAELRSTTTVHGFARWCGITKSL